MQTYIVQKGDTLYGISKQFGISVTELMRINNLTNTMLSIGMVLNIPSSNTSILYVVKRGDTLYSIGKMFGVSVADLMKINNLNTNIINIGQELRIPVSGDVSIDGNSNIYAVKKGDTLYSISRRFGISIVDLKNINNLTNDILSVGQILYLSKDVDVLEGKSCYGEGYIPQEYVTYTVKSGDSLYIIAKRYGVTVNDLIKLNNLSSNNLSIGQVLKIKEVY